MCLLNPKLVAEAAFERVSWKLAITPTDQIASKAHSKLSAWRLRYCTEDCRKTHRCFAREGFLDVNSAKNIGPCPPPESS